MHDPPRGFQEPRGRDRVQILHGQTLRDGNARAIERQHDGRADGFVQQTLEPHEIRHERVADFHEHVPDVHPGVLARAAGRGVLHGERARPLDARRVLALALLHVPQRLLRIQIQTHASQIVEAAVRERRLQSSARHIRRAPRNVEGRR